MAALGTARRVAAAVAAAILLLLPLRPVAGAAPAPSLAVAVRRAQAALAALQAAFYIPAAGQYVNAVTVGATENRSLFQQLQALQARPASLWASSWALAAVEDVAELPGGKRYRSTVAQLASQLQAYWDAGARPPAYAPSIDPGPQAVKYFDDNAWTGLDLVEAWRLTGRRRYLYRAEAIVRYEQSGWDTQGGGIWWSDQRTYRNTAANAPAAELAAELYLATRYTPYLRWAQQVYRWENATLVEPNGRVWDGIGPLDLPSMVKDAQYTYNYGSVIAAAVMLYRATGRRAYLDQARRVAAYALRHLRSSDGVWRPQARFNGVLSDGLVLLIRAGGGVPGLRQALWENAARAWRRDRARDGLFGSAWDGPPPTGWVELLTQTGAVRTLAAAAAVLTVPSVPRPQRQGPAGGRQPPTISVKGAKA